MRRVLLLLFAALSASNCTAQVAVNQTECLDLSNSANRCTVDQDGSIDLSSCSINDDHVEAGYLAACFDDAGPENILELDLAFNDLKTLSSGMFGSLTELTTLDLNANDLTTLASGAFDSLTELTELGLDNNDLASLPSGVFDSLTELTELSITFNDLKTLPPTGFGPLTRLNKLDIRVNNFTDLPSSAFDSLTGLTELHLSSSNHLAVLPSGIFDSLTALEELDLSYTGLTDLPSGVFDSLTELTYLNLFNNDLTTLSSGVFGSLTELQTLLLSANAISTLPPDIFDSLAELEELTLGSNGLTTLPSGVFDSLTKLDYLSITSNELTSLPAGIFDSLTALTSLTVDGNSLATLPSGIFDSLTELTGLYLGSNALTTLPSGVFDSLTKLTRLLVQNNEMTSLPSGIFDSLPELDWLFLYENNLSTLPSGVFDSLTKLATLRLDANQLTTLPAGIFDEVTGLTELWLEQNPDLGCLPTVPTSIRYVIIDEAMIGTECGCELPDGANPCDQGLRCTPGAVGYTCDQTCAVGIPGILVSDVCCPTSCGACGGSGCNGRNGGDDFTGREACCQSGVTTLGRICSASVGAPCVVAEEQTCAAGIPGILNNDVCCPTSCGACGGSGCNGRDGGDDFSGREACCAGGVTTLGRICSATVGAPCVVAEEPTCAAGIPGILSDDVCCPTSCGACGGYGCNGRNGGDDFTGREACCQSGVTTLGRICSATVGAPCVVAEEPTCAAGIPGILADDVCCPTSCGACGGYGCNGRNGGDDFTGSEACCQSGVTTLGRICSATVGAPCVVAEEQTCAAGIPGILADDVCCPTSCGACGGYGCNGRNGGDDFTGREACCQSGVTTLGRICSATVGAPCVVAEDNDDDTPMEDFTCDGVQKGDYCCSDGCGECGGSGCSNRGGGLTGDDCCQSDILASGRLCSATRAAPCFFD